MPEPEVELPWQLPETEETGTGQGLEVFIGLCPECCRIEGLLLLLLL